MTNLYTQQSSNIRKTWFLITMSFVLVIGLGWLLAQYFGNADILYLAVGLSLLMNIISYWYSDKIALSMSGARAIKREDNLYLYRMIENLAITAGLPMPRVYEIDSPQINAFATGRNPKNAAVAVTHGALTKLENEELEGVLAHELSHIGNRDMLVSTIVIVLAGAISIVSDIALRMSFFSHSDDEEGGNPIGFAIVLIGAILAPIAATLIQLAVSRKREFLADASGALLTRYPQGLANALRKIGHDSAPMDQAHTATAHLFLSNPFKGKSAINWVAKLFMTHPPLEERIRILEGLRVK